MKMYSYPSQLEKCRNGTLLLSVSFCVVFFFFVPFLVFILFSFLPPTLAKFEQEMWLSWKLQQGTCWKRMSSAILKRIMTGSVISFPNCLLVSHCPSDALSSGCWNNWFFSSLTEKNSIHIDPKWFLWGWGYSSY